MQHTNLIFTSTAALLLGGVASYLWWSNSNGEVSEQILLLLNKIKINLLHDDFPSAIEHAKEVLKIDEHNADALAILAKFDRTSLNAIIQRINSNQCPNCELVKTLLSVLAKKKLNNEDFDWIEKHFDDSRFSNLVRYLLTIQHPNLEHLCDKIIVKNNVDNLEQALAWNEKAYCNYSSAFSLPDHLHEQASRYALMALEKYATCIQSLLLLSVTRPYEYNREETIRKVLDINPNCIAAKVLLAQLCNEQGNDEKAIEACLEVFHSQQLESEPIEQTYLPTIALTLLDIAHRIKTVKIIDTFFPIIQKTRSNIQARNLESLIERFIVLGDLKTARKWCEEFKQSNQLKYAGEIIHHIDKVFPFTKIFAGEAPYYHQISQYEEFLKRVQYPAENVTLEDMSNIQVLIKVYSVIDLICMFYFTRTAIADDFSKFRQALNLCFNDENLLLLCSNAYIANEIIKNILTSGMPNAKSLSREQKKVYAQIVRDATEQGEDARSVAIARIRQGTFFL